MLGVKVYVHWVLQIFYILDNIFLSSRSFKNKKDILQYFSKMMDLLFLLVD